MAAGSRWRSRRLLVLCYHGISLHDEHLWSDLYVSPGHLERRLALLRRAGATVLPLHEALQALPHGDLPPQSVAITFDDGAYDFSARAVPLLGATGAHSTLYLTTWYCGRPLPVFDTMASYLLWKGRGKTIWIPGLEVSATVGSSTSEAAFQSLHGQIRAFAEARAFTGDDKQEYLTQLASSVGVDFGALMEQRLLHLMTPGEVAKLDRDMVAIELHTHRHRTPRDRAAFLDELRDNQQYIARYSGDPHPRQHFCYPSGDHVPEYAEWLRSAGVVSATTCNPGLAEAGHNPFFIPRIIDTEQMPDETFRAWVSGTAHFTSRTALPQRLHRRVGHDARH